jgi:hypothetical protein
MPFRRPKSTLARAVVPVAAGLVFFVVVGLVLWGVAALVSGSSKVDVRLGDDVFRAGDAKALADEIAENGPLLFPGLVGPAGTRAIGAYHAGDDPASDWQVFSIVRGSCVLEVDRATLELIDPCTGERFPSSGTSLPPVPWVVDRAGDLVIDLTPEGEPGRGPSSVPTTTSPRTSTPTTIAAPTTT